MPRDLSSLARAVRSAGLTLRGAFHPAEADQVPDAAPGRPTLTAALVGFGGKRNWSAYGAAPEAADRMAHPLDRWSRRVIDRLAGSVGARAVYPFPTDAPPYHPFQRWARIAEAVHESPIKILIHPTWGLWHSYRGALLFEDRFDLPPPDPRPSPCDGCEAKPCLTACPVAAFEDGAYSVPRCVGHLGSAGGADCLELGCRARRACPVGAGHRYEPAEAAHHMGAFFSRRARADAELRGAAGDRGPPGRSVGGRPASAVAEDIPHPGPGRPQRFRPRAGNKSSIGRGKPIMSTSASATQFAPVRQDVVEHFTARAPGYDRSSHWCGDPAMMDCAIRLAAPSKADRMLDVACGTGLVARAFRPLVGEIVGLDLTPAMAAQAEASLDDFVLGSAERMPFGDGDFDLAVCRQGLQFMDAQVAVNEMARVTRPGGRVLLINLCAYGDDDRDECFEILRLRNPARRHFFLPRDVEELLLNGGFSGVTLHPFVSSEDVDTWSGNGAIEEASRGGIRDLYRDASPAFQRHHRACFLEDGRIIDQMLFILAVGRR